MYQSQTRKNSNALKLNKIRQVILASSFLSTSILMGLSNPSYASSANDVTANVEQYSADFFMGFEPRTLFDVLETIPAANSVLIAMNNNSDSRGFGSAGDQILINNKRVSGKENDLRNELNNIQAQDVNYVELIRGTKSGLDVQSKGLIVNVILKEKINSSLLWSLGSIKSSDMEAKPKGSVIYSAGQGNLKYRVGLTHNVNPTKITWIDQYKSMDGVHTDTYTHQRRNWFKSTVLSTKLDYVLSDKTAMQINGLYDKIYVDADITIDHQDKIENVVTNDVMTFDWKRDTWEISGDITHELNQNNNLKLLFVSHREDSNDQIWRETLLGDNERQLDYQLPRLYTTTENILHGTWKHTLDARHSFDSGLEAAVNGQEDDIQFIEDVDTLYHSTEINDIEERRYEAFFNYNFAVSPNLNILTSLVYEKSTLDVATSYSLISEENDGASSESSRTFNYLKPRLNIRYDIDDFYQARFNYERTVSQLDLTDFVPEFNRDETRLEETNPDLKPEVRDEVSFTLEKQWLNTEGSISLTPYYHKISDLITEIPLISYSGDGNVDSAKEYGVTLDSTMGLDFIGLDNTIITTSYTWRDSEATHPFTGKSGPIERLCDNEWNLKINQSKALIPGLSFSLTLAKKSPYQFSRYDYQGKHKSEITANGFIDYQINKSLKMRLNGSLLRHRKTSYERTRFDGIYTDSAPSRQEARTYDRNPRITLTLFGNF